MSIKALETCMEFLQEQGYVPERKADELIYFRAQGGHYYLTFDSRDPGYVRMMFPNFWRVESEFEKERILEAADWANREIKGAKIFLLDERVCASLEMFLPDAGQYPQIFDRALGALDAIVRSFAEQVREPEHALDPVTESGVAYLQ